jgi:hypothetical protein
MENSGLHDESMVQYEYASEKRIPFEVSAAVLMPMSLMALMSNVGGKKARPGSHSRSLLDVLSVRFPEVRFLSYENGICESFPYGNPTMEIFRKTKS